MRGRPRCSADLLTAAGPGGHRGRAQDTLRRRVLEDTEQHVAGGGWKSTRVHELSLTYTAVTDQRDTSGQMVASAS